MPHTKCKEVWTFDELDERAKESARDWYRSGGFDYEWWDGMYESFVDASKYLGITIDTKSRSWHNTSTGKSGTSEETCIYFSGFSSQGDGACFEGTWRASDMKTLKALRADFGTDKELWRIHQQLRWYAKRYPDASCTSKHTGHYSHSRSTTLDPILGETIDYNKDTHEGLEEALIDFMDWMYRSLEKEFDYLNSNEAVDESILSNEYEFTQEGKRA